MNEIDLNNNKICVIDVEYMSKSIKEYSYEELKKIGEENGRMYYNLEDFLNAFNEMFIDTHSDYVFLLKK